MNATLTPKSLLLKLPYTLVQVDNLIGLTSDESIAYVIQGNGLAPFTSEGQLTSGTGNIPGGLDRIVGGMSAYSRLYDKYYVLGSKITIEVATTSTNAQAAVGTPYFPNVYGVLLSCPFRHFSTDSTSVENNDSWQNKITRLLTYAYEDMISWPGCKSRLLGPPNSGKAYWKTSMYRSTKSVYGVQNTADNNELQGNLLDTTTLTPTALANLNPHSGFFYYLRLFNQSDLLTLDVRVDVIVKMKFYVKLVNREFNFAQEIEDIV